MNLVSVLIGVFLFGVGILTIRNREQLASRLFRFYNRPRREGTFAWFDRRIAEPGESVCVVIASVFGFVMSAIGLTVVVLNAS